MYTSSSCDSWSLVWIWVRERERMFGIWNVLRISGNFRRMRENVWNLECVENLRKFQKNETISVTVIYVHKQQLRQLVSGLDMGEGKRENVWNLECVENLRKFQKNERECLEFGMC